MSNKSDSDINVGNKSAQGEEELTEDRFYGELDNIMMWCFTLGFNAARREYGDQYKSAKEAEPHYEDNLDSWIQDIITSHEELLTKARLEAYGLLYWKYKELNGQTVDMKFAEAYGVLKDELTLTTQLKKGE